MALPNGRLSGWGGGGWRPKRLLALALAWLLACCGPAPAAPTDEEWLGIARLWRDVGYMHPALAERRIDWDAALAAAIPALEGARSAEDIQRGVERLLQPLDDGALRVWRGRQPAFLAWREDQALLEWVGRDTALLHLHAGRAPPAAAWNDAQLALKRARNVIVDLRPVAWDNGESAPFLASLAAGMIDRTLVLPAEQVRFTAGARPVMGEAPPGLHGGMITLETTALAPAPGAKRRDMLFLVDGYAAIPRTVLALQQRGQARIVVEQGSGASWAGQMRFARIADSVRVEYTASRLVTPTGYLAARPDAHIAAARSTGAGSDAVRAALRHLTAAQGKQRRHGVVPLEMPVAASPPSYDSGRLPNAAWRQVAAFKLWAEIDLRHPARYLLGDSWDQALLRCLHRMSEVKSELDYGHALQEMAVGIGDGHTKVWSRALNAEWGTAQAGLRLSLVEGKILVTGYADTKALSERVVSVGAEIVAIDGEAADARLRRYIGRLSSSTVAGATRSALDRLLGGADGSIAFLLLRDQRGTYERQVRRRAIDDELPQRIEGVAVRIMPGNIAYVDLDRLELTEVDAMFQSIAGTAAVIFDMRGYPRQTAWAIAPRLAAAGGRLRPVRMYETFASAVLGAGRLRIEYPQRLAATEGEPYTGRVAMLIDDRTISQAEHTALLLEAASDLVLVGSPSAGANGDLRHAMLPGKVTVSYSGLEAVHADGRGLQRVGLQPDLNVSPTIEGLRDGRDEVLERALGLMSAPRTSRQ